MDGLMDESCGSALNVHYQVVSPYWQEAYLPKYASLGAAGMDLHACIGSRLTIRPGERVKVPTGIAMQLPTTGAVGLVYARSGLAWKQGLALPNGVGVIDSDYTGEIQVLLTNFSTDSVEIAPGDRIAQLVIAPIYLAHWIKAEQLDETERGDSGFGSTGVKAAP